MKQAIDVAPFGELADPRVLADLAALAEERGWDGFFVWDHIVYRAPVRALADPWVALAAVACATSSVRIGPLITPLSRRRVHKVARETVSLDLLSSGRLTFGVGLGSARNGELEEFGEVTDPRERAQLLDQGLDDLARYWAGEFEPVPVQRPRIPVWVAAEWPHRKPVRRALKWDGVFPIGMPGPEALAELVDEIRESRSASEPFDFVADLPPGVDPKPWAQAGATWIVTDFGIQPTLAQVREVIDAGPLRLPLHCPLAPLHCPLVPQPTSTSNPTSRAADPPRWEPVGHEPHLVAVRVPRVAMSGGHGCRPGVAARGGGRVRRTCAVRWSGG